MSSDAYAVAGDNMGGKKQPKEIRSIEVEKAKSGGHVITHHHKNHPSEVHVAKNDKDMLSHMMASIGSGAPASGDPADAADPTPDPAAASTAAPPTAGAAPAAAAPAAQ